MDQEIFRREVQQGLNDRAREESLVVIEWVAYGSTSASHIHGDTAPSSALISITTKVSISACVILADIDPSLKVPCTYDQRVLTASVNLSCFGYIP